jgi:hypothetical protein
MARTSPVAMPRRRASRSDALRLKTTAATSQTPDGESQPVRDADRAGEDGGSTRSSPRPIFVIGSLRSGASLVGLSLAQHPGIMPVLDTAWIDRFALGLQQAYAEDASRNELSQFTALGVDLRAFFVHFGETINRLLLGPYLLPAGSSPAETIPSWRDFGRAGSGKPDARSNYRPTRWVDTCYTHVFNVFALHLLFPAARFIHTVRDADEVVTSLTAPESEAIYKSRHVPFSTLDAYEHWLDAVTAGLEAERAFGSDTVLRIWRASLVAEPEAELRRCLDFLDEPFDPQCLRPFRSGDETGSSAASPATNERVGMLPELQAEVEGVRRELFAEPRPTSPWPPDRSRMARLEAEFVARGQA